MKVSTDQQGFRRARATPHISKHPVFDTVLSQQHLTRQHLIRQHLTHRAERRYNVRSPVC